MTQIEPELEARILALMEEWRAQVPLNHDQKITEASNRKGEIERELLPLIMSKKVDESDYNRFFKQLNFDDDMRAEFIGGIESTKREIDLGIERGNPRFKNERR